MHSIYGDKNQPLDYQFDFDYTPYNQLSKLLTSKKTEPQLSFLNDVSSTALQLTLKNLSKAAVDGKNPKLKKGFPVAKKKKDQVDSFSFNVGIKLDRENSRIYIPKIGFIRFKNPKQFHSDKTLNKKHREILGSVFNVSIFRKQSNWYVSVQTKRTLSQVNPETVDSNYLNAIDMGCKRTITLTNQVSFEYQGKIICTGDLTSIKPFAVAWQKLKKLQRQLAKKKVHSSNFNKIKQKINKLHTHIANIRLDFNHKITTAIVKQYAYIAVEDLKIKNMTTSSKGTFDKPGKNVKQKSGLNRSILDQGWGQINGFLKYKLHYTYGTELIKINPKNTSCKCSACGHTEKGNRKSQAVFHCLKCGLIMNADDNAAINIQAAGLAVLAFGGYCFERVFNSNKQYHKTLKEPCRIKVFSP